MVICFYTFVSNKQPWRYEFLERSLPLFLASDFPPNTHIIISDDCSTDSRVKPMLCAIKTPKNCRVEFIFRKANQGCDSQMVKTMRYGFAQTSEQCIVTADSDVLYHPLWMRKLIEAHESVKHERVAMVTCFDTKSHPVIGSYNDLVNEKKHCGGFCAFINREIFFNPSMKTESWDWQYSAIAQRLGYHFFCTKRSWVEHMGKGKSGNGKSWDTAKNFVGLDNV